MKSKLKINLTLGGILNKTSLLAAAALLVLAGVANAQNEFGTGAGNGTTTGFNNIAYGSAALYSNTSGSDNTAYGTQALYFNTTGIYNAANGCFALVYNTTGSENTANGVEALYSNTTGTNNIGLGYNAGSSLTTGDNNIDIGNYGVAGEAGVIRIGDPALNTATFIAGINGVTVTNTPNLVAIDQSGQLGTVPMSTLVGPAGANGTNGADGLGLMPGAFVFLAETASAPIGFTKIGTRSFQYRDLKNRTKEIVFAIYQRNQPN